MLINHFKTLVYFTSLKLKFPAAAFLIYRTTTTYLIFITCIDLQK